MRLYLRPAAIAEAEEARAWYESQRSGLGEGFVQELDRALGIVLAHPLRFRCIKGQARVARLRRFPHAIVYRVEADLVSVLAIFHGKRDPRRLLRD